MDKVINLLDQIIEKNIIDDFNIKKDNEAGESWNVFHLKLLKKMVEEQYAKS
jgi:hypothetical protein